MELSNSVLTEAVSKYELGTDLFFPATNNFVK